MIEKVIKHCLCVFLTIVLFAMPDSVAFAAVSVASLSATVLAGPTSPPPSTATPKPTVNPAYAKMAIKVGDQGPVVESLQQRLRDLGFYNYKITDYYGNVTVRAVQDFQKAVGLAQDGVFGGQTASLLFANDAPRQLHNARIPTPKPTPTPKPATRPRYGKIVEWSTAKGFVAWGGGPKFQCIDFRTGKTYYLIRVGGSNHMDVEPATAADTATLKSCYGGGWSWDRRPTLVRFGGVWYAASINGWPHGKETVANNNMNGQICLHFKNSKTHGTSIVDSAHQRCINQAAGN